jgi:hypothetical protein
MPISIHLQLLASKQESYGQAHGTVKSVGGIRNNIFFFIRTAHPSFCFSHSCLAQIVDDYNVEESSSSHT